MSSTTIAAISTAQGQGGIGVIRISGDDAVTVADKVFESAGGKALSQLKGYTACFGHIVSQGEIIDEAVATVFRAPKSYTGENVVELSCHGGVFVVKEVLRCVLSAGAVPAEAGEFTKRAFLNGKIDLTEAEAVMDIISAKSKSAARAALRAKEGALWKRTESIKARLVDAASHLCAWADYPEEDIEQVTLSGLEKVFDDCIGEFNALLETYDQGQVIKNGIDTVIAGKPNTGKSTLMNLLSGRNRSIVTDIPGTTRDIVEETVTVEDITLRLSDTAGLHSTEDRVEKIGVDIARERLNSCSLVLAVFDASRELDDDDKKLLEAVQDIPCIGIINKTDKECKIDKDYIRTRIKSSVDFSAKSGEGCEQLYAAVKKIAGTRGFNPGEGILSNERQRNAVLRAKNSLEEAVQALREGVTLDAVTVALEEGLGYILELTGEKTSEVVVDSVFHNFCVGK